MPYSGARASIATPRKANPLRRLIDQSEADAIETGKEIGFESERLAGTVFKARAHFEDRLQLASGMFGNRIV